MNVLSLFDGISCGYIAAERAGIKVDKYYASEICEYSMKISKKNFSDIIQLGDIRFINGNELKDIDLMIGGSPCQSFSFAGHREGMKAENNIEVTSLNQYLQLKEYGFQFVGQSYLFWEYVRLLKEIKPKYFLLENVKMAKKWSDVITDVLGVYPIMINSSLVSAQSRPRFYWTNIPNVTLPQDRGIYIEDIVQEDIEHKYLPKTRLDYRNYDKSKVDKSVHKYTATHIGASAKWGNAVSSAGKAYTIRRVNPGGVIDENYNIREFTPIECERLQTLPDDYTLIEGIKKSERIEAIGNGWTVDVIAHIFRGLK